MRTISSTLLAAQKAASGAPYVNAVVHDRIGGVRWLTWTRLYTGAEPDGYHAATMPDDGSLVRARVTGGRVYYQRIVAPGAGSAYSAWTDLGACGNADVALCSDGARVLLFYVDAGATQIKVRESTDSGATLGAAVTAATGAGAVTWLAADVKSSGDACLLYNVGATVYAARRTAGAWGAPAAWANSVASVAGLALYYRSDWNAVIAGADVAGVAFVWSAVFGDGGSQAVGTWSPLREVARASAGSSVTFRAPFLSRPDVYRMSFVEKYTGTAEYGRPHHSFSPATADFAFNLWREGVPFNVASEFGQAIAFSNSAAWLATPAGVWTASLTVAPLDVSNDVVECVVDERPFDGRLRLTLRNDDGHYSTLPSPLRLGAEIRLGMGYRTPAGTETSDGPAYWVEAIEHRSGGGEATVAITARDAWGIASAWRARRTYAWAAGEKNVFGIMQYLCARAGLEFSSVSASPDASGLFPAYTMHPGESALAALRRLLTMLRDVLFVRGEFVYMKDPLASEASAYSYGGAHALRAGRYGAGGETDRVQVFGKNVFGERFDWAAVGARGDALVQVLDANLTTQAQAESRADALLRQAAIEAASGEITVAPNVGQELWDVVEVTDAGAGLVAAKRRVVGIRTRYSAREAPGSSSGWR